MTRGSPGDSAMGVAAFEACRNLHVASGLSRRTVCLSQSQCVTIKSLFEVTQRPVVELLLTANAALSPKSVHLREERRVKR